MVQCQVGNEYESERGTLGRKMSRGNESRNPRLRQWRTFARRVYKISRTSRAAPSLLSRGKRKKNKRKKTYTFRSSFTSSSSSPFPVTLASSRGSTFSADHATRRAIRCCTRQRQARGLLVTSVKDRASAGLRDGGGERSIVAKLGCLIHLQTAISSGRAPSEGHPLPSAAAKNSAG